MTEGLVIDGVSKSFDDTKVLRNISLDVEAGAFVSLLGPSGCGKSTLLRVIAGFESQDRGHISIAGKPVDHLAPRDRELAMVFQSYALYPHMTVAQNISLPLEMRGMSGWQRLPLIGSLIPGHRVLRTSIGAKTAEAASLCEIDHLLERRPGELSGGQRQRVALARAMVRDPALFLMDEPLSNLDAKLRVTMRAELVTLNKRLGATMLYVTHDQTEAMTMSDKIALMMNGEILQYAAPEALYGAPAHLEVATFIGQPTINCFSAKLDRGVQIPEAISTQIGVPGRGDGYTLAVRPEAFVVTRQHSATAPVSIPARLERSELLGPEVLLWFTAHETGQRIVVQMRAADHAALVAAGRLADLVWLEASGVGIHLFGPDGAAIAIDQPAHMPARALSVVS